MFPHLWYAPEEMAGRVEELRRPAETDHLGRRLMAAREPAAGHRWLLYQMGRSLVAMGRRLEQYGPQPCTPLEGGIGCTG